MAKHIFVMGGVLSSIGKGIASASIGFLLKRMNYSVGMQKMDPYLNVDPGTMSPFQHGEVFVTDDGGETDLDLGHYERFIGEATSKYSNATSGVIYERVIQKERRGDYLGKTVQVIPHVTNEIKLMFNQVSQNKDIVITEIGGTVGDIESLPFLEAIRQYRMEQGFSNTMFIFLTYIPFVKAAGELKTKPTQHAANKLREIGILPDIILCRAEYDLDAEITNKIALFTNVPTTHVLKAVDNSSVYEIPKNFYKEGIHELICKHFALETRPVDFSVWDTFLKNQANPEGEVNIAICGKYIDHQDAYKSVEEAIKHAAAWNKVKANIHYVDSEKSTDPEQFKEVFANIHAVLIPGGFGIRGISGKIAIAKYARENNIPYFGICIGMQVAVIEFAKSVCDLPDAYSSEFEEECKDPIIDLMLEQKYINSIGGTMRLGAHQCQIKDGTLAHNIYHTDLISERHRHRYEVNNKYRDTLIEHGMVISGTSPDEILVEIVELPSHPFYIGVQFHPEFKSRPDEPQKIFTAFVKAAKLYKRKKTSHAKK